MNKERLYDAFGELIYALAMADGSIQEAEIKTLESYLENYEGAKSVSWSFNYAVGKETNLEDAYKKALNACINNGPDAEYEFLFDILDKVAASDYVHENESALIQQFKDELREEFLKRY